MNTLSNTNLPNLSYKLEITLSPEWSKIYERMGLVSNGPDWEYQFNEINPKDMKAEKGYMSNQDYYVFVEYYHADTGMIQRFRKDWYLTDGNVDMHLSNVNEFRESGFLFAQDSKDFNNAQDDAAIARLNRFSVEVGDHFVRCWIFNKDKEKRARDFNYAPEDYFFQFPIDEVFRFLYELGTRFDDIESKMIIKWPDQIEEKFKELGITHEFYDDENAVLNIDEQDKDFYKKWWKPKISLHDRDNWIGELLSTDLVTYSIKVTVFKPWTNNRFNGI